MACANETQGVDQAILLNNKNIRSAKQKMSLPKIS